MSWQPLPNHLLPPCWTCKWFGYYDHVGNTAICLDPTCSMVRSQPETGCACHEREPGADSSWNPQTNRTPAEPERIEWAVARRRKLEKIREEAIHGYGIGEYWPVVKNVEGDVRYPVPRSRCAPGPTRWSSEKPAAEPYKPDIIERYLDRTWGAARAKAELEVDEESDTGASAT